MGIFDWKHCISGSEGRLLDWGGENREKRRGQMISDGEKAYCLGWFPSTEISRDFTELSWISFYLSFLEVFGIASLLEALAYLHNAKAWNFNTCVIKVEDRRSGKENGEAGRGNTKQDLSRTSRLLAFANSNL